MAFVNAKPDPTAITELSHEMKQDILRAFALGNTIETIGTVYKLERDDVETFLNNRVDEIVALKDFYAAMSPSALDETLREVNERSVRENEKGN